MLDHALTGPEGADNCNKFVEILGLRTIFPLFMKTPGKHGKKGLTKDQVGRAGWQGGNGEEGRYARCLRRVITEEMERRQPRVVRHSDRSQCKEEAGSTETG